MYNATTISGISNLKLNVRQTTRYWSMRCVLSPGSRSNWAGWGRAIQYKYSDTPLSCVGSTKWVGGRFNYGVDIDSSRFAPFPALYLAEDMETGLREMQGPLRARARA